MKNKWILQHSAHSMIFLEMKFAFDWFKWKSPGIEILAKSILIDCTWLQMQARKYIQRNTSTNWKTKTCQTFLVFYFNQIQFYKVMKIF